MNSGNVDVDKLIGFYGFNSRYCITFTYTSTYHVAL